MFGNINAESKHRQPDDPRDFVGLTPEDEDMKERHEPAEDAENTP